MSALLLRLRLLLLLLLARRGVAWRLCPFLKALAPGGAVRCRRGKVLCGVALVLCL